ncbi:tannase/feruloyl esterase family alpha/beta hydrolase [Devosia sp. SL43]|uniref:tannase/feruloyl esterase family alpha/beta hydrolase n=1 Tax=Devosia sp. SL43 TaxID=2806348 RepID=UPI001F2D4F36|nr:tannase/feruloyl esterase family alpha/beta hydrolase [Devosia sp. SL43]
MTLTGLLLATSPALAQQQPSPEAMRCGGLRGLSVAAAEIGTPSGGADVYSAQLVEDAAVAGGAYCKVNGAIDPVDPAAPDIIFQVNLPLGWNKKALHFGGGGYNGALIEATGQVSFGADDAPTPLARGYATFGSDSGHQSAFIVDGTFLLNDEALANFGGLQLKKTHDVALAAIKAFYDAAPEYTYFQGNSQGGHEGLLAIQRWPADYDGALVTHPANPFSALQMSGNMAGKALYQPGAWVSPTGVELLNGAVLAACDGLDGLEDGLISNVAACNAGFDIESLRCEGDVAADTCFTGAQITALNVINSRWESPVELQGGATGFARWPIFEGGDLYGLWGMGQRPEASVPPAPVADFGLAVLSDPLIRFAITRDPAYNSFEFDPADWADRVKQVSELVDANEPDLSPFADAGGKMLLMHGTTDFAITPHNTTEYYERVVEAMGSEKAQQFMRYYLVPGFGHGSGQFVMRWDPLTALENWVETGAAPDGLVTTDVAEGTAGRSRPMCEYPAYPHYNEGADGADLAANFTCQTE